MNEGFCSSEFAALSGTLDRPPLWISQLLSPAEEREIKKVGMFTTRYKQSGH